MIKKDNSRFYQIAFSSVYPHYITKAEKKDRTAAEVNEIIFWLTGYNQNDLDRILADKTNFQDFFEKAPQINPNVNKIKGVICGYRVEDIEEELMQNIR